jgi:hypothetical protein
MSKEGLRFDWHPILQADFINDLAAEVMSTVEAARGKEAAARGCWVLR